MPGPRSQGLERVPAGVCLQGQTSSCSIASVFRAGFLALEFQALEERPGAALCSWGRRLSSLAVWLNGTNTDSEISQAWVRLLAALPPSPLCGCRRVSLPLSAFISPSVKWGQPHLPGNKDASERETRLGRVCISPPTKPVVITSVLDSILPYFVPLSSPGFTISSLTHEKQQDVNKEGIRREGPAQEGLTDPLCVGKDAGPATAPAAPAARSGRRTKLVLPQSWPVWETPEAVWTGVRTQEPWTTVLGMIWGRDCRSHTPGRAAAPAPDGSLRKVLEALPAWDRGGACHLPDVALPPCWPGAYLWSESPFLGHSGHWSRSVVLPPPPPPAGPRAAPRAPRR